MPLRSHNTDRSEISRARAAAGAISALLLFCHLTRLLFTSNTISLPRKSETNNPGKKGPITCWNSFPIWELWQEEGKVMCPEATRNALTHSQMADALLLIKWGQKKKSLFWKEKQGCNLAQRLRIFLCNGLVITPPPPPEQQEVCHENPKSPTRPSPRQELEAVWSG